MPLHLSLPTLSPEVRPASKVAPEDVPAWVAEIPTEDAPRAGRMLADQLAALNAQRFRTTLRQDLNEVFYQAAMRVLPQLERSLADASLPLSNEVRNNARIAEDLVTELTTGYKLLLVEQSRRLFGFASSGRALLPVLRSMSLLARRVELAYRVYATVPKGAWSELHELFQFATRRALANRCVDNGLLTPTSVYTRALLLAFADPLHLMPGDLDVVIAFLDRHGDRATLGPANDRRSGQGLFVIKPQRDLPGYAVSKRHHPVPQSHDIVLGTLPLAELLLDRLAKLANGESPIALELPEANDPARLRDILGRLVKHWGAVPNRKFNRLRTHARVEISVGIDDIWAFLDGQTPGASGEWMVTNESPRGFALAHVSGAMTPLRVGEVVGLRARDARTCHVCVVRWVLSDNPEHLELGLEELAPTARPAQVRKLRSADKTTHAALLLPEVPGQNRAPSIITPLMALDSTCELCIGELQAKLRVRPSRVIERTASVQLLQFNSVS